MPKYPHVPRRRQPLYPHRSGSQAMPQAVIEGGQRIPPQYRGLIDYIDEPLPDVALMTRVSERSMR